MTDTATPNARPGQSGASQPTSPARLPAVFAQRHVDAQHVGDPDAQRRALDASRRAASESPNAPASPNALPPTVDLRHGTQREQAAEIEQVLRRR
jgi:hypothetical protein